MTDVATLRALLERAIELETEVEVKAAAGLLEVDAADDLRGRVRDLEDAVEAMHDGDLLADGLAELAELDGFGDFGGDPEPVPADESLVPVEEPPAAPSAEGVDFDLDEDSPDDVDLPSAGVVEDAPKSGGDVEGTSLEDLLEQRSRLGL